MAPRAVRPDPLDRHLNREHNGDDSQQTGIHLELPHREIRGGYAREKQQHDQRCERTKNYPDFPPRREQQCLSQRSDTIDHLLGAKA